MPYVIQVKLSLEEIVDWEKERKFVMELFQIYVEACTSQDIFTLHYTSFL